MATKSIQRLMEEDYMMGGTQDEQMLIFEQDLEESIVSGPDVCVDFNSSLDYG